MQTVLHPKHVSVGARLLDYHDWRIPEVFSTFEEEYWALQRAAGLVDLSYRGKLAVRGADAVDYLHRMLSNEVKALQPGEGNYCFMLDAQGHVLAEVNLLAQEHRLLIDCEPFLTSRIREHLEKFVIMDEVEIEDLSGQLGAIGVEGPLSREVVCPVIGMEPPQMKPLAHLRPGGDPDLLLARMNLTGEGFWLIAPLERLPALWDALAQAARQLGGRPVGFQALEATRIEAGVPRYGVDIDEKNIPQETGQFRALSFTKGCYPGQEIVERVRSRGQVNRKLVGLIAAPGTRLAAGMKLLCGGREAGRVTSAAHSPQLERGVALAYLRREHAEPGKQVAADGGAAEVAPLPFPRLPARTEL
jgi:folate-binding protein YgfZ